MSSTKTPQRILNVKPDSPDIRDKYYLAEPIPLKSKINPPANLLILDQGSEGSCTGNGLAAVINHLYQKKGLNYKVSRRMLYEMAKRFDKWDGEDYSGSSCRGAVRGWFNMGVTLEELWPYIDNQPGHLTIDAAKEARSHTVGAYFRLHSNIIDYHSALNKTGIIYVSAKVHSGWHNVSDAEIPIAQNEIGGHAFAIVGYNNDGFWVQNSWGTSWGNNGIALWRYEDWAKNIQDGWVVSLALPTPQIWDARHKSQLQQGAGSSTSQTTRRVEILGHYVHLDDGYYHDKGRYSSNSDDIKETAKLLQSSDKYDHFMFYAHGGLNSPKDSAKRIRSLTKIFKENGIYNFHFMYDTGLLEEVKDVIFGKKKRTADRAEGFTDWIDSKLEKITRKPGRAIWKEMKLGASLPFENNYDGVEVIQELLTAVQGNPKPIKIHIIGHSAGAVLTAHLLKRMVHEFNNLTIDNCFLMAPACILDLFDSHYIPLLDGNKPILNQLTVYNLSDELEQDDNVGHIYRKSLLYLVSNAFEEKIGIELLGMQKFNSMNKYTALPIEFIYSDRITEIRSRSKSHGGFDNDPATLNNILERITSDNVKRKFTKDDLKY